MEEILEILDNIKEENNLNYVYNGIAIYISQYMLTNKKKNNNINTKILYDFYMFLLCNLNEMHKKHLIDSILNMLQYDCFYTKDFSLLFQDLFFHIDNEDIEKQLLINFLKRYIYEPLPWGISYTFESLKENEKYKNIEKMYIKGNEKMETLLDKTPKK